MGTYPFSAFRVVARAGRGRCLLDLSGTLAFALRVGGGMLGSDEGTVHAGNIRVGVVK